MGKWQKEPSEEQPTLLSILFRTWCFFPFLKEIETNANILSSKYEITLQNNPYQHRVSLELI